MPFLKFSILFIEDFGQYSLEYLLKILLVESLVERHFEKTFLDCVLYYKIPGKVVGVSLVLLNKFRHWKNFLKSLWIYMELDKFYFWKNAKNCIYSGISKTSPA